MAIDLLLRSPLPDFRYQLARKAFFAEDHDEAIDHIKFAMRQDKTEDRFCFLLGLVYLQMGDQEKSRKWMARAEKLAGDDPMKSVYSAKMERLERASR